MDERGPSEVRLVMHLLLVHLEVCPVGLGSRGNTPLPSWGHVEALEGSVPALLRVCAKGRFPK